MVNGPQNLEDNVLDFPSFKRDLFGVKSRDEFQRTLKLFSTSIFVIGRIQSILRAMHEKYSITCSISRIIWFTISSLEVKVEKKIENEESQP